MTAPLLPCAVWDLAPGAVCDSGAFSDVALSVILRRQDLRAVYRFAPSVIAPLLPCAVTALRSQRPNRFSTSRQFTTFHHAFK